MSTTSIDEGAQTGKPQRDCTRAGEAERLQAAALAGAGLLALSACGGGGGGGDAAGGPAPEPEPDLGSGAGLRIEILTAVAVTATADTVQVDGQDAASEDGLTHSRQLALQPEDPATGPAPTVAPSPRRPRPVAAGRRRGAGHASRRPCAGSVLCADSCSAK